MKNTGMAGVTHITPNERAGLNSEVFSGCLDYYPFGAKMPGRTWEADTTDTYRFGFQGMLKDNEMYGAGNQYSTMFRQYDPRLGRWLSPDPIQHPWQSSYTAFNNNPIYFVDPLGLEGENNNGDEDPLENPEGGDTYTTENGGKWKYDEKKEKWVGQGFEEQTLDEVVIEEKDPNKEDNSYNPSGVADMMRYMRFKWRMEGDLRGFESIKDRPDQPITLTGNYADIKAFENALDVGGDYASTGLNYTGTALTVTGTGLLFVPVPGARPAGVSLIGYGGTFSAVGSGVDATQNFAKGNYTRGAMNLGSIGLSRGTGRILKRMHSNGNISFHSRKLLEGGTSIGQGYGIGKGKKYLLPKDTGSE